MGKLIPTLLFIAPFLLGIPGAYAQTTQPIPLTQAQAEVGFAHKGSDHSAHDLVLKLIRSAQRQLLVEAYNFTDKTIIDALVEAHGRGVEVRVVHDAVASKERGDGTQVLEENGIAVKVVKFFHIMHDKVIIADQESVETGSYNYSKNADKENAENVLVLWHCPALAQVYGERFEKLWGEN